METVSIPLRGVERHKAPTLADDGGGIECINLRPSPDGLDLVHDKILKFTSLFPADSPGDNISAVYRHRALPEGYFVVVLNKRKMVVFANVDGRLSPLSDRNAIDYFAQYEEDILEIGELNNVLVVRISNRQDYYLWYEDRYRLMPEIKMPQQMSLSQDFTADRPKNVAERPFFQAVIGFNTPNMNDSSAKNYAEFVDKFNENRDRCLQFIQGLRAEEEANQRKLGKFVGHVLVRCAFKTAQDNYIAYGTVLHAEIGAWASSCRTSRFPSNEDSEKNLPPYKRIYRNILRSFADITNAYNQSDNNLIYESEEKGSNGVAPIPLACFRSCLHAYKRTDEPKQPMYVFDSSAGYNFQFDHNDSIISCAGYSQLPVLVGAIPYRVWKARCFRGNTSDNDDRHGISEETDAQNSSNNRYYKWRGKKSCVGVYAPAIHYSYPVLRMVVDDAFIKALDFYKETKIISSLCIAMTAPVKHGNGTSLYKVRTIEKENLTEGFNDDELKDEEGNMYAKLADDPGENDYMYVYGYPRNPDTDPDKLMNRNFYIVKDINIEDVLASIKDNVLEIPLQLKDIGAIEKTDAYGNVTVEVSQEVVDNSLEEQIDPNRVSLNTIESAKPLPTDSFSTHTLLGSSYMEYNRRLHLFGVSVLMSEGYTPTSAFEYDQQGFGRNKIVKKGDPDFVDSLYMEYILSLDKKKVVRRVPIESYMTETDENGISKGNIILNDILTYPDYRCTTMRLIKETDGNFHIIGDEIECKYSVLNNLAFAANTFEEVKELPDINFTSSNGLVVHNKYSLGFSSSASGTGSYVVRNLTNICNSDDGTGYKTGYGESWKDLLNKPFSYNAARALSAYKDDDTLIYKPRIVNLNAIVPTPLDYANIDVSGTYEDSNRVQVSGTDDVFAYPSLNSYRAGSIENQIIAANSVYGQVTEQKFGMFPLYLFTKEGVYTMEQGTGDILYSNVCKINDDVLSGKRSLTNAGDMIAFATLDGLRLIQGKDSQQVSDTANGTPFLNLAGAGSPFLPTVSAVQGKNGTDASFADYLSSVRLADEIQGCEMLWDSYNHEVVLLCRQGERAVTWAYNVDSQQMYKRKDLLNDRAGFGVVLNGKSLVWCSSRIADSAATSPISRAVVAPGAGDLNPGGSAGEEHPDLGISLKGFSIYDFTSSDQERTTDGSPDFQQFLYVSNPIKAGTLGYKHIEHSVLRMFGQGVSMDVEYFGSLDGRKWFRMGGGRIAGREEYSDMLMRRMPCSTRYIVVVIKGNAAKLQINRLEAEVQARYATRLR
ncbi:MAG: hypothetical protein K2L50_00650 [Bacteroidales bacterium]|nr:hypothetical protein [Bacteroidales bacterium]